MPNAFLERKSTFWFVAGLIALLFGLTSLPWQLDDYDQAKQAFTSFEMVREGHWFYQHTPNEKIATKPPLVGWISAAIYGLTRSWDVAWRLPSILAALALIVVLTRAALAAYGNAAGLIAMSAFGLNLLSPRLATLVRTDMPLALCVFLLGLKIWQKVRSQEPWELRDQFVVFTLLTATMLIKGPIVYAFLLPGMVAFQWWTRGEDDVPSAWCGWWPWIASLAVFAAWVEGGIMWVPQFYEQVVLREFAGRFSETVHRPQPLYFYLPHLLHKFAPWSLLLIALAFLARKLRATGRKGSPEIVWLVCWSLGGLLVMSLVPSKRVDRIFPILPPLCLLVAALFANLSAKEAIRKWSTIALIFAALFTTGYAGQRVVSGYRANEAALVNFGEAVRREAAVNGWRYEVVGGKEEGLLLYLRRTRFVRPAQAIELWNAGALDAVVVPADESDRLLNELRGSVLSKLEATVTINDRPRRYLLLKRS